MNPLFNRLVFILSLIGLFVAGYLWYMHANPQDIPCGGSHGCADVANSKYSQFPWGIGPPVAACSTKAPSALPPSDSRPPSCSSTSPSPPIA
ncbi:MAG: vitamin K epoxide reductase family protein, partial [Capsulimonadales bacterium]|nr:vitamin K epoxide reductase family protein [Capsulimonadales bacterium]